MSKSHRLFLVSAFAVSLLTTTACGRRIPQTDPCAEAQAQSFARMSVMGQYPTMVGFAADAPADCGNTAQPTPPPTEPTEPSQPAPGPNNPPAPGPAQPVPGPNNPPASGGPDQPAPGPTNPPAPGGPDQPAPGPTNPPAPGPTNPTPQPPAPTPTPPAATPTPLPPTEAQVFFEALKKAGVGVYTKPEVLAGDIQKMASIKATGFGKGKYDTVEENIKALWDATRLTFASVPNEEEYPKRAMAFASKFSFNYVFFVDVAATKKYGSLYILRLDPETHEVVGIHPDETALWNAPSGAVTSQSVRSMAANEGTIFYYGEERGKWLTGDRFVKVPVSVLNNTFQKEQQIMAQQQAMRAQQAMYQARSVNPYYR